MRSFFRLVSFLIVLLSASPPIVAAQDSLLLDSTRSVLDDSLQVITVLSDSERVALDSAAVAALADTVVTERIGRGTPVVLFGRQIFRIYSGLGPYTEEVRAERIADRLARLARSGSDVDSLQVIDGRDLTTLRLGTEIMMSVTEADARGLGMPRLRAARHYASVIRTEVSRVRERSTFRNVLLSAGLTVVLLTLLLFLLKGLGRLYRWLDAHVITERGARLRPVMVGKVEVLSADRIVNTSRSVAQLLRIAVSVLLIYVFLTTVFGLFPWTQSWSRLLLQYMITPLQAVGRTVVSALPNLLAIIVIVVVIRWVIKLSNFFFGQIREGHIALPGFYPEFAEPTRKIARFLLIVLAILLIYPYTPVAKSKVFQGLTIFLGVLFSIGSSTAISNIVAGVVLTYTRAFQLGDRIRVGETIGDVIEKTFLVTRIRTSKNEDVAIPNSTMLSNQITNYSSMARSGGGVILHTTITIGYDVAWQTVERLLLEAAARTSRAEKDPPPFVLTTGLGDFSVAYQLNVYTLQASSMARVYSDVHRNIQDVFAEEGVEILSPVYESARDGSAPALPGGVRGPAA